MTQGGPGSGQSGTQSIDRAFDILKVIASSSQAGISLKAICDVTGITKPTVHRILATLLERGIVEKQPNLRYTVGRELTLLGLSSDLRRVRELAAPALTRLSEEIGDAVFLAIRSGLDSVCVDRRIGAYPIQVLTIEIGSRRPLGISANSVAMLSRLPPAAAEEILDRNYDRLRDYGFPRRLLAERIQRARKLGYVVLPRAIAKGTSGIAVPVKDVLGRPVAAVSTIAISSRQRGARVGELVEHVARAAQEISEALSSTPWSGGGA